jgi:predicted choloylglycine hydrolase
MIISSEVRLIVLEGKPQERGQIYGDNLKPMILEHIERWKYQLFKRTKMNPDKLIDQFMEETDMLAAVKRWGPNLLKEVEGIGEGAGIDFNTIFALQCMDEWWWWYKGAIEREHSIYCSTLGCFKEDDNPALLAQTMDLSNIYHGLEILLHIKDPDSSIQSFVYTPAGIIGTCGLNNKPLGICRNTLGSLTPSEAGYPVAFMIRSVLEQPTLDKAIEFIKKIKHASGQNYMIGDSEKIVDFECSANNVSPYTPYEGSRRLYHTNHPLVNDDVIFPPKLGGGPVTTYDRFNYLEFRLKDPSKRITVETVKYIQRSHEGPISRARNLNNPGGGYTMGAVIYDLSIPPELLITLGPPHLKEHTTFRFS